MKKLFIVLFALMASGLFAEWICDVQTDQITDESRVVFIYTEGGILAPVLIMRFQQGELDAYINWSQYFSDRAKNDVIVRFDKNQPITLSTALSTDSTATFFLQSSLVLSEMLKAESAVFRAVPYRESPVTIIVPLSEFKRLYEQHKGLIK